MIKINLAKVSAHVGEAAETGGSSAPSIDFSGFSGLGKSALLKLGLVFIFTLGVYIWESRVNSDIQAQLKARQAKLKELETEVAKFGSAALAVEEIKKERKRLHDRLRVIAKISSKRAFKIQTLEAMQQIIPEDCWLKEIKITKTQVELNGYSRNPSSVQSLVEKLSELEFLSSVTNEGMVRTKLGETNVSEFSILAKVLEN